MARRLPSRVRPSRNRARSPSRGCTPSPASTREAPLGAGAHATRSRTRRATADEARATVEPMPGGAGCRPRWISPTRPTAIDARSRRLRWRGAWRPDQAITIEEPSTLPVARKRPVAGERHDRGLAAGSHPSRSSTRRATADEAKNPEQPVPGGAGRARSG